jgi:hypothetical protein
MVPLLWFIGRTGGVLWAEWRSLRRDQVSQRASEVVGFVNISLNPTYAKRPADWMRDEGEHTLLWATWDGGENRWFRVSRGDLADVRVSWPIGRDTVQVIDYPLFEDRDGDRWGRLQDEALVVSLAGSGDSPATAYPILVLDKVEVVHDRLGGRPVMVVYSPVDRRTSVFEGTLDGRRITMGHCGYFVENRPLLYDRGTESLWAERDGAVVAVAGSRKGAKLGRIAQLDTRPWSEWKDRNPGGRLLIGANRSPAKPVE